MSKHLSPQLKLDNNGIKWYRRVTNVDGSPISAGQVVMWSYYEDLSGTSTGLSTASADFNYVRVASTDEFGSLPVGFGAYGNVGIDHRGRYAGVAIEDIPYYGQTIRYPDINMDAAAGGSGTGWIQFKGPVEVCAATANAISAGESLMASGALGEVSILGTPNASAGSCSIGWAMESKGAAAGKVWMFLTLD